MEGLEALARIAELGLSATLLIILFVLWREFREQNKFIRDIFLQGEAERRAMAERLGMDTITLKAEAQAIRERWSREDRQPSIN